MIRDDRTGDIVVAIEYRILTRLLNSHQSARHIMKKRASPFPAYTAFTARTGETDSDRERQMWRVWERHAAAQQSPWDIARWWRAISRWCGRLSARRES